MHVRCINTHRSYNISQQINDQQQSQKDITSASQSLADLAQELQRIIGHFTV